MRLIKINNDVYINPDKVFSICVKETAISVEHGYTSSLKPAFHIQFAIDDENSYYTPKKSLHEIQSDLKIIVDWINSDRNDILDCTNLEKGE